MPASIILLGAWKAGKSTVGRLLADALQMPFCDLPAKSLVYGKAAGLDEDECGDRLAPKDEARSHSLASFEVLTLERGLQDHPNSVIEVGPTQIVRDQP